MRRAVLGPGGAGLLAAWALALGLDILQVDAAQYASIARTMAESSGLLEPIDRGEPYLGKPLLLFWASQLSFRLFGVSNWAYRLPSFLAFLLGLYATYRLALRFHDRRAAILAVLTLATCQGGFLMVADVRTDTLLTGLVALSLWQAARWLDRPRAGTAALLGLAAGLGFITKGTLALAIPVLALLGALAARRAWRTPGAIGRMASHAAIGLAVVAVVALPMFVGLYGQHGMEGVTFHLWAQSFGRITEGPGTDVHGPFYLIPQLAWIFLPWTFFLALALRDRIAVAWRGLRAGERPEVFVLSAFLLTFLGLSAARSKLPHYVYVTLPPAAVLTGAWLREWWDGGGRSPLLAGSQTGLLAVLWAILLALLLWAFPSPPGPVWAALGLIGLATAGLAIAARTPSLPAGWRPSRRAALIGGSLLTAVGVNLGMNAHLFPRILAYQAEAQAGRRVAVESGAGAPGVRGTAPPGTSTGSSARGPAPIYVLGTRAMRALDLYSGRPVIEVEDVGALPDPVQPLLVYTNPGGLDGLRAAGHAIRVLGEYHHFRVSKLTFRFVDPRTRPQAVSRRVLAQVCAGTCPALY